MSALHNIKQLARRLLRPARHVSEIDSFLKSIDHDHPARLTIGRKVKEDYHRRIFALRDHAGADGKHGSSEAPPTVSL